MIHANLAGVRPAIVLLFALGLFACGGGGTATLPPTGTTPPVTAPDADGDGVPDASDACPATPAGATVASNGCEIDEANDADRDGVGDSADVCPGTPTSRPADAQGCADTQRDADDDGISDADDQCPATEPDASVDTQGCSAAQRDSDGDGVADSADACPGTLLGETVDATGCSQGQMDDDADGVINRVDQCDATPESEMADEFGCSASQRDADGDGVSDANDLCPLTSQEDIDNNSVDAQGCGESQQGGGDPDADDDGDGVLNGNDSCPNTPQSEIDAGSVDGAGCGPSQLDDDNDNISNADDICPTTPAGQAVDAGGCSAQFCQAEASAAFGACHATVADTSNSCYNDGGMPCASDDADILAARSAMADRVSAACGTDTSAQGAGFGPSVTTANLIGQLDAACVGEPATLVARSYGGPQARLLSEAPTPLATTCLTAAYDTADALIRDTYADYAACVLDPACNGTQLLPAVQTRQTEGAQTLTVMCSSPSMLETQGSTPEIFLQRAADQARCMVAQGLGDTGGIELNCGPDNSLFEQATIRLGSVDGEAVSSVDDIPLGEAVHVTLDSDAWGTRCGDGSDYAFVMRLSESPEHLDKAILHQEGGGVCLAAQGDCVTRPQSLFEARDNNAGNLTNGYLAVRDDNPLRDWSAVFQPYCTQDLHIGGGAEEAGGRPENGGTLFRYGSINVRASTQFYRDLIWRRAKADTPEGYKPDQPQIIYSGTSAGAYGVQYNLHHPLDEMRWENTLASPHAAFTIEGGSTDLALLLATVGETWETRPYQPPYCLEDRCSLSVVNHPRHASRMGVTPFQQILVTSAQHDNVQEGTQGYPGPVAPPVPVEGQEPHDWINALREQYCEIRGTPNLYFHLGANTAATHVFLNNNQIFDDTVRRTRELLVSGTSMLNLLADVAMFPGSAIDRVEDGPTIEGVEPFPCDLTPMTDDGVDGGIGDATGDADGDGIENADDICAGTSVGSVVATNGCAIDAGNDDDADGVANDIGGPSFRADACPDTPAGELSDEFGCSATQRDTDGDGVVDASDQCPGTLEDEFAPADGCPVDGVTRVSGTQTRYSFNNQCLAMRSGIDGGYVTRVGAGVGYLTSANIADAEPFFMKPTALGSYMLYNSTGTLMSSTGPTVGNTVLDQASPAVEWTLRGIADATVYPPSPSYDAEPTPEQVTAYVDFVDPLEAHGAFKVTNGVVSMNLAVAPNGSLVVQPQDTDPRGESWVFEPIENCAAFPEASSNVAGEDPTGMAPSFSGTTEDGRVLGMADVHVHISATTFLGRTEWGSPFHRYGVTHALGDCTPYHGEQGTQDTVGALFSGDMDGHDVSGWPTFPEWPARDFLTHEAIYWKWIERAWQSGLRVAVNDVVENATLCELQRASAPADEAATIDCNEMNNAANQVGSMFAMQDYIDAQYGGPGQGFFQIVRTPEEARTVVANGQLAVVLGIEISNLLNCQIRYNNPFRLQQPFEETGDPVDGGVTYDCAMTETGAPNEILTQLQRLWGLGIRQIISIHEFDNAFGGNGIFDGMVLNLGNRENSGGSNGADPNDPFNGNPAPETPSGEFWTTYDCPTEGGLDNDGEPFSGYLWGSAGGSSQSFLTAPDQCTFTGQGDPVGTSFRPGGTNPCYPDRRQCNARWMTPIGLYFYSKLMEMGFIFDWDHMEYEMKTQALELAEAQNPPYPFVSTHGTFGGTSHEQAGRALVNGGFMYPSNGSSRGFRRDMDETLGIYQQVFADVPEADRPLFGFGFGTDTNGLSGQTGPRGNPQRPVEYPYRLFEGELFDDLPEFNNIAGLDFEQPATNPPEGDGRTWHQDVHGNAHYGMLSGFVEEIRLEGRPDQIRHLYNSAEVFIQSWERTLESQQGILDNGLVQPDGVLRPAPVSQP
ncbi:hypothetical protein GYB61_03790 [bacterium]|nr:hypothetical protein [bacterium]